VAFITLSELVRLIRERADHETTAAATAFVEDDPEMYGVANSALAAFHNLMCEMQRHEWALTATKVAQVPGTGATSYTLPTGVMLVIDPIRITDGSRWGHVYDFDSTERAGLLDISSQGDIVGYRYRVNGPSLEVYPAVSATYTLHVDHVPEFEPLAAGGDKVEMPYGWWDWPVWLAVTDVLTKEDRDATQSAAKFQFHDRRIRALASRRAGRLRIVDRWTSRRSPMGRGYYSPKKLVES
jgi:hypothetical protein